MQTFSKRAGLLGRICAWALSFILGISTLPANRLGILMEITEQLGGRQCLPEEIKNRAHDDWVKALKTIPRSRTVFCGVGPPQVLLGTIHEWHKRYGPGLEAGPPRVSEPGEWYIAGLEVSLPNGRKYTLYAFSYSSEKWLHTRLGEFGWDDIDGYYNVPSISIKRIILPYETLLFHWNHPHPLFQKPLR